MTMKSYEFLSTFFEGSFNTYQQGDVDRGKGALSSCFCGGWGGDLSFFRQLYQQRAEKKGGSEV
jgi:hypothetical protein